MSAHTARPLSSRRKSVAGVAFAPASIDNRLEKSTANEVADKENMSNSPHVAAKKKKRGRVSFASFDDLCDFDTEEPAINLTTKPPPSKKPLINVPTPEKKFNWVPADTEDTSSKETTVANSLLSHTQEEHQSEENGATEDKNEKMAPATPKIDKAAHNSSTHDTELAGEDMEMEAEDMLLEEDHEGAEFTLDDVLAQDAEDLDMDALATAADDELSSIYASGKGTRLSMVPTAQLDVPTEDETSFKIDTKSFKAITEEEDDDVELSTRGWSSILGPSRRDSLSLPSFTRRDSFSLLSNRHLRSTSPEKLVTSTEAERANSTRRRSSIAMESTQSDFGKILAAESEQVVEDAQFDPEETVTLTSKGIRSRRTSLVMDITRTDLGEIIQDADESANTTRSLRSARKSRTTSRRTSIMDMTITDVGSILMREEEPIDINEDDAATQTIRMDLTRTDLGTLLDSEEPEKIDLRRTISFKNRRQSLAMDETVSNFGAILDGAATTSNISEAVRKATEASAVEGEETVNLSRALETAEERAAKPVSNLLAKLTAVNAKAGSSPVAPVTTKSRRQSVAMDMTVSNLGTILDDSADATTRTLRSKSRRQSVAMDHTISNFGEILADGTETSTISVSSPKTPKGRKSLKPRQSLVMDMTISNIGEILVEKAIETAVAEEEYLKTPEIPAAKPAKSRRQSLAMDMTMSNIGGILIEEEASEDDIKTPEIAQPAKSRRQSLAMDMTISGIGEILETEANTAQIATPKAATPKSAKSRRESLAMDMTISSIGEIVNEEPSSAPMTPASAKKRDRLPTKDGIISRLGQLISMNDGTSFHYAPSPSKASKLAIPIVEEVEESAMEITTPETTATLSSAIEIVEKSDANIEENPAQEEAQEEIIEEVENAMEMTEELIPTDIPIEEQDTIELPVIEDTPIPAIIVSGSELNIAPIVEADTETIENIQTTENIQAEPVASTDATVETNAAPAVADLALLPQSTQAVDNDDVLFSDVVSITSSFPNLSMSISSRNAIRRAMEAAGMSEPTTEVLAGAQPVEENQAPIAAASENAMQEDTEEEQNITARSITSIGTIDSVDSPIVAPSSSRRSSRRSSVASRRQSAGSRRKSVGSRRNSTRLSFLDTIDEPEDDMFYMVDTAQLDAFLDEDTRSIAKRTSAPAPVSTAALFSALAVDNEILRVADASAQMEVDPAKHPLLAALSRAIPHKVSSQPFDAEAAHEIAMIMAKTVHERQAVVEAKKSVDVSSSQMDVASPESESQSIVLSQQDSELNAADIDALNDEEESLSASIYDQSAHSSGSLNSAMQESAQLDAAQKRFEARVEAQLRTPAARRRSLMVQGVITPGASPRRIAGRSSFLSTGRLSFGGVESPTPSHATSTMTLSGLDSLTTVANGNSLSRFLSTFGVNFLDSISSRRQSLGIRVAEPRSDYDRMMTVMRSEPELGLTNLVFSSLATFAADCEAHISEMEAACREQCASKEGVYQLFAQCITVRQGEARRDLAALKQLALSEAKCHLNERFLGYHYESQLNQTLQITLASAKSYLSELEDRQTATFRTKMSLSKQVEAEAHGANVAPNAAIVANKAKVDPEVLKSKVSLEEELTKAQASEALAKTMLGWQLRQLTPTSHVYDFRNAVELVVEFVTDTSTPKSALVVTDLRLSSVMRVRTAEDEVEHQLVESLLNAIPIASYCENSTTVMAALSDISTAVGRILDLVTEIRVLRRSWFVESIERVSNLGAAIAIRFSDPISGNRFVAKLAIGHSYPFVAQLPVEVDLAFTRINAELINETVEEEVAKYSYKLLTRVCKRLDRLCKA